MNLAQNLAIGLLAIVEGRLGWDKLAEAYAKYDGKPETSLIDGLVTQGILRPSDVLMLRDRLHYRLEEHGGDRLALIEQLAREAIVKSLPPKDPNAPAPLGSEIGGRYQILNFYKEGGLGRIWIANQRDLNRQVVLKELHPKLAEHPGSRGRFLKEAQITGQLEHPNIIPVYGIGYEGDRPYYAMRFAHGQTFADAIAAYHRDRVETHDPLLIRRLLISFVNVCQAVSYAHSRGVIHRDLKPANIVLGEFGEVIILDWGLAKIVGEDDPTVHPPSNNAGESTHVQLSAAASSIHSRVGAIIGTPAYMAPEQAAGLNQQVDRRTDIYGLGAILFAILAGREPHVKLPDENETSALARIVRGPTPTPRSVDPAIHPALDAVCAKAMALAPEDRYATPKELESDVLRWLADEPVSAYVEPRPQRLARWAIRHRVWVQVAILGLLLMCVVAAMLVTYAWQSTEIVVRLTLSELREKAGDWRSAINVDVNHLRQDVLFVSQLPSVVLLAKEDSRNPAGGQQSVRDSVHHVLGGLLRTHGGYARVLLIDKEGREIMAVRRDPENAVIFVPPAERKNHKGSTLFEHAATLKIGEVLVTDMPRPPILEDAPPPLPEFLAATAIHDPATGEPTGVVSIHLSISKMLAELSLAGSSAELRVVVVNQDGLILSESAAGEKFQFTFDKKTLIQDEIPSAAPFLAPGDPRDDIELERTPNKEILYAIKVRYNGMESSRFLALFLMRKEAVDIAHWSTFRNRVVAATALLILFAGWGSLFFWRIITNAARNRISHSNAMTLTSQSKADAPSSV